jgi:hypothetical protein
MTDLSLPAAPAQAEPPRSRPSLFERVPPDGTRDADTILDLFVDWAAEAGFELYGSGKSLPGFWGGLWHPTHLG